MTYILGALLLLVSKNLLRTEEVKQPAQSTLASEFGNRRID